MLCLLALNNLYRQLLMQDLKKIKLSKYQYELSETELFCFGFNFHCLYSLNKFIKIKIHIPRKHLPSPAVSTFEKTFQKLNTSKS